MGSSTSSASALYTCPTLGASKAQFGWSDATIGLVYAVPVRPDTPATELRYYTNDRDATTVHRPYPTMVDIHPV